MFVSIADEPAMNVIFCHGLESAPHGRKYLALREAGFAVTAPDFRNMNLAARVDTLTAVLASADEEPTLVGSSYGGLTALCASILHSERGGAVRGLVLCAPALARAEEPAATMALVPPAPTTVIHGTRDDVIPIGVSRAFAAEHPSVHLIEVDDGHRLAESLAVIVAATRAIAAG